MTKNIEPLHEVILPSSESMPDRTDLSRMYERTHKRAQTDESLQTVSSMQLRTSRLSFLDTILINLFIVIPYSLSFLSIAAIFSFGSATIVNSSFESRFLVILLAIPALIPWYFAIRKLRDMLWGYSAPLFVLLSAYLLFLLPMTDITVSLYTNDVSEFSLLFLTAALSQLYIWLIVFATKNLAPFLLRIVLPVAFVSILIFFAATIG